MGLAVLSLVVVALVAGLSGAQKSIIPQPFSITYRGAETDRVVVRSFTFSFFTMEGQAIEEGLIASHQRMVTDYKRHFHANKSGEDLRVRVLLNITDSEKDYNRVDEPENYVIEFNSSAQIELRCQGYVSFLRALETFYQLVEDTVLTHVPVLIDDKPNMRYRGLMVDTARTWLPLDKFAALVRGMQRVKLNAIHIHLSDSDSFPVVLDNYPEITQYGSYGGDHVYHKDALRAMVAEAQRRGVVIIPELDGPSHSRALANSPNLNIIDACHDYPPNQWGGYCLQPPCGQLDPTLNLTYEVVESVMTELQEVFFQGYFHFGGDEINQGCWHFKYPPARYTAKHSE